MVGTRLGNARLNEGSRTLLTVASALERRVDFYRSCFDFFASPPNASPLLEYPHLFLQDEDF